MRVLRETAPSRAPALELAVSHALLKLVAAGEHEPVARLYRPAPTVAFGRVDALRDGFGAAREAARAHGFEPVVRVVGGLAAAYTAEALVLDEIVRQDDVATGIRPRFEATSAAIAQALRAVGADARVGRVAGEYCPGDHTVSAAGRIKLAGAAQRSIRGAALVSSIIVVGDGDAIRAVLRDVYAALGRDWNPATAGALADVVPSATVAAVEGALLDALGARRGGEASERVLALARTLEGEHRA